MIDYHLHLVAAAKRIFNLTADDLEFIDQYNRLPLWLSSERLMPLMLWESFYEDAFNIDAEDLVHIFTHCDVPLRDLHSRRWIEMFEFVGCNIKIRKPIQLYRGCTEDQKLGMSWTASIEVAEKFMTMDNSSRLSILYGINSSDQDRKVYTAIAPPSAILAYDNGREEDEYIVNPAELEDVAELVMQHASAI